MGTLVYGFGMECEIEDRTLAHVKAAVDYKLRRKESFFLSWTNPAARGGGRTSVWMSPNTAVVFHFAGSRAPELNRVWVDAMCTLASSPRGLVIMTEEETLSQLRLSRSARG